MKEIMKGIDLSLWQTKNFDFIKAEGYRFAIIKGGGRLVSDPSVLYVDNCFETFYAGATSAGMYIGAYWYTRAATVAEAKAEAEFFYSNCLKGKKFDMPIWLDVEDGRTFNAGKRATTDVIKTFLGYLESKGYWVGIYASLSFFNNRMYDSELQGYAHWIAQYNGGAGCTYNGAVGVAMWQYASDEIVAGRTTDTNICYVDYPTKIKKAGKNGYTAHVHDWQMIADAYNHCEECKSCGERRNTEPHTLYPRHNDTHHFETCKVCEANVNWEPHSGGKANCSHRAICEVCGAEYGELDPNTHTGETKLIGAVAATTEHTGWSGNIVCADCGKVLSVGKTIPKKKDIPGDVNGDGSVDSRDLIRLTKELANGSTDEKADVNGDGSVDSRDLINLMKKISGGTQ